MAIRALCIISKFPVLILRKEFLKSAVKNSMFHYYWPNVLVAHVSTLLVSDNHSVAPCRQASTKFYSRLRTRPPPFSIRKHHGLFWLKKSSPKNFFMNGKNLCSK